MIGLKEEVRLFNAYLDTIQSKIYEAHRVAAKKGDTITPARIKSILSGEKEKSRMILEVFQQHNNKMDQLIGKGFARGTLIKYRTCYRHTSEFIQSKYRKTDLPIDKLNYEFISEYEFWLKSSKSCAHNTTMKCLTNFKKIVMICVKNGWLKRDPFINFKMSREQVNRTALTESELERIAEKDFGNDRLDQVRDAFLFCCYTGLAYIDVSKLTPSNIVEGFGGKNWIITSRQKTGSESRIPLLPPALTLLKKYEDHPVCVNKGILLPVLSNQKMNRIHPRKYIFSELTRPFSFAFKSDLPLKRLTHKHSSRRRN